MKAYNLKNIFILILSSLGVIYFAYTWLSTDYNDKANYDYLENNFGQFVFSFFLMLFIYKLLSYLKKDKLILPIILFFFVAILILNLTTKIFLWPFMIILLITFLLFLVKKWL